MTQASGAAWVPPIHTQSHTRLWVAAGTDEDLCTSPRKRVMNITEFIALLLFVQMSGPFENDCSAPDAHGVCIRQA